MGRKSAAKKRAKKLRRKKRRKKQARRNEPFITIRDHDELEGYVYVHIGIPTEGMPEAEYEEQGALDRLRRFIIMYQRGVAGVGPTADKGWLFAPAHGDSEGAYWKQWQASTLAHFTIHLPRAEGVENGKHTGDASASALHDLLRTYWYVVDTTTPDRVVEELSEDAGKMVNHFAYANGWRFQYSADDLLEGGGQLCQFSAQLVPVGRGSDEEDWQFLGAVMATLGVPGPDGPAPGVEEVKAPDLANDPPGDRHRWIWRVVAS